MELTRHDGPAHHTGWMRGDRRATGGHWPINARIWSVNGGAAVDFPQDLPTDDMDNPLVQSVYVPDLASPLCNPQRHPTRRAGAHGAAGQWVGDPGVGRGRGGPSRAVASGPPTGSGLSVENTRRSAHAGSGFSPRGE